MMCLSDAEICPQTYVMVRHDCWDHDMVAMERLLFLFMMIYKLHFVMIVLCVNCFGWSFVLLLDHSYLVYMSLSSTKYYELLILLIIIIY